MPLYNKVNTNKGKPWYQRLYEGARDTIVGKPEEIHQLVPYEQQQTDALDWLLNIGREGIENPYQGFEPIKQDTLRSFYEDILPQLQNRFNSLGDNSATSPILRTQLSSAGAGLAERLASMQAQYGQNAQQNSLQQLQLGLNPRSQFIHSPSSGGALQSLAGIAGQGIGRGVGNYVTNAFRV